MDPATLRIRFQGDVVVGKGEAGPMLGHPTLNVCPDVEPVLPHGMHGAWAAAPGTQWMPCTLYVGTRPTFESDGAVSHEIHVLQVDDPGILNASRLGVDVAFFHRPDQCFTSTDSLRSQQEQDRHEILQGLLALEASVDHCTEGAVETRAGHPTHRGGPP